MICDCNMQIIMYTMIHTRNWERVFYIRMLYFRVLYIHGCQPANSRQRFATSVAS